MIDPPVELSLGLLNRMSVTTDELVIVKPTPSAKAVLAELRKLVSDSDSN